MKTEAIRWLIDYCNKFHIPNGVVAEAELTAIETALAAKDVENAALSTMLDVIKRLLEQGSVISRHDSSLPVEFIAENGGHVKNLYIDNRKGKVLIDIEKLREIEWVSLATRVGVTACPACGGSRDCGGHADAACWLGNILKDTQ